MASGTQKENCRAQSVVDPLCLELVLPKLVTVTVALQTWHHSINLKWRDCSSQIIL